MMGTGNTYEGVGINGVDVDLKFVGTLLINRRLTPEGGRKEEGGKRKKEEGKMNKGKGRKSKEEGGRRKEDVDSYISKAVVLYQLSYTNWYRTQRL